MLAAGENICIFETESPLAGFYSTVQLVTPEKE